MTASGGISRLRSEKHAALLPYGKPWEGTGDGSLRPRIRRNDYSVLNPPPLGAWRPTLDVSVIIPAHGAQDKLDLTLASLAAQSYPGHLMEVVVVDDATEPPLTLPEIRPENTRLITSAPGGWGSAHAVNSGVAASDGTVILRLDADMVTYADHVESQMRWHHLADYVVALGHKLFTEYAPGDVTAQRVHDTVSRGEAATLFDRERAQPHWVERVIDRHDKLRAAGHMSYSVFIGATGSLRRSLFETAGGMAPDLVLGGDSEFAYRVGQAGAVFVPDLESSSWHLGLSQMQSRREDGTRFRHPYVANRVPLLGARRRIRGRQWQVPYVDVVVDTTGRTLEEVRETVERLLGGDLTDIRVTLVGPWSRLGDERRAPLDDPLLHPRLIHETFAGEGRVRYSEHVPEHDPAVTFQALVPAGCRPTRTALRVMTETANSNDAGLLRVVPPERPAGAPRYPRLERVAAYARARHLAGAEADIDAVVDEIYGQHWMDGEGTVVEGAEPEPPVPADYHERLAAWKREAHKHKRRADRIERKVRLMTRSGARRLIRRFVLRG